MIHAVAGGADSGADSGAAPAFAAFVLREMQRIDSQAIHANELFRGPFEVVGPGRAFVPLKGLDATRPLDERAEAVLRRVAHALADPRGIPMPGGRRHVKTLKDH